MNRQSAGRVIIVMGVSGAGKTTVGSALADKLRWAFYEGDDLHPRGNVEKMSAGNPLTDADRVPWLESLRQLIHNVLKKNRKAVVSCSALKRSYRDRLREGNDGAHVVYLKGTRELLRQRMLEREGHFMKAEMLESQFDALEEPEPDEEALALDAMHPPEEIVRTICDELSLSRVEDL